MIKIQKLNKNFGNKVIFKDFSYDINDNSMIALIGKSGSGKSTLLNIIGLIDSDYSGNILYDGQNVSKMNSKQKNKYIRDKINYLFQNYALIDDATVEENLMLAMEYDKIKANKKIEKINNALKSVGLVDYNSKKIFTLSGGEQQRVALARIMIKNGEIVLADEPTGNLDSENSKMVINILKDLQKMGKTIIVVTHSEEVAKQCDEIISLELYK